MAFKELTITEKVAQIAKWIGVLAVNPVLGGGGMIAAKIAKVAATFGEVIGTLEHTHTEMDAFYLEVEALVKSQGHPTDAQWAKFEARDASARAILAENKARLEALVAEEAALEKAKEEAARVRAEEEAAAKAEAEAQAEADRLAVPDSAPQEEEMQPISSRKKRR